MEKVVFKDLGVMDYQSAWDYQEELLQQNVTIKSALRESEKIQQEEPNAYATLLLSTVNRQPSTTCEESSTANGQRSTVNGQRFTTTHHLLFVEHPPVYTLGKSGDPENILISDEEREKKSIQFFKTNRGGDITFHGPGQVVGYPILDLEKFYTDIGKYLRNLEEVIILTMQEYGLQGERSAGETGVWLDAGVKGRERKICAMGVRCSRWITMHGFAFNINTQLDYFNYIIPCGIRDKAVTSLEKELGKTVLMEEVKEKLKVNFAKVFGVEVV